MVAILGDPPAFPDGPPAWPRTTPAIRRALQDALRDHQWGTYDGPHTDRLQRALRDFYGVDYVVLTASGTFGMELALQAARVRPGSSVVMAAYEFPGNFLSVLKLGATPLLVDVRADDGQMDVDQVELAMRRKPTAVIATHLHGGMVDVARLRTICEDNSVTLIEDAAQMPGATIAGRRAATIGHIGVISFGGSKLMSAGRGGAVLTDVAVCHQRIRLLSTRANDLVCPLSQLQAVVLVPQLHELETLERRRASAVAWLSKGLEEEVPGLSVLRSSLPGRPGYYKVGLLFDPAAFAPLTREAFVQAAQAEGIAVDVGFRALHSGRSRSRFEQVDRLCNAERFAQRILVLHHPVLLESRRTLERLIEALGDIYRARDRIAKLFA